MRDLFPDFYPADDDAERQVVTEGHTVLDTNILLGLYRIGADEREAVLTVLERIQERLWIPHQVALEYQRGRAAAIKAQRGAYDNLLNQYRKTTQDSLAKPLASLPDSVPKEVRDEIRALLPDLATRRQEAEADFIEALKKIRDREVAATSVDTDPTRERIDAIFAGRVGPAPSPTDLIEQRREANDRYLHGMPPGHEDHQKEARLRGNDHLIWTQILSRAGSVTDDGKPFLFVTDEEKIDWYEDPAADRPRDELRQEFAVHNAHGYRQVRLRTFLRLTNKYLGTGVPEDTIEAVAEAALARLPWESLSEDEKQQFANIYRHILGEADSRALGNALVGFKPELFHSLVGKNVPSMRLAMARNDQERFRALLFDALSAELGREPNLTQNLLDRLRLDQVELPDDDDFPPPGWPEGRDGM